MKRSRVRDVKLSIPEEMASLLRDTIGRAEGNEVFFAGRVAWPSPDTATLEEVEVLARGNRISVPAIIARIDEWDVAIHNHPSGCLEPSGADTGVASALGNREIGFAIIDNACRRHYLVVPPCRRKAVVRLEPEEVRRIFGSDGPLGRALEGYSPREGQIEMALEVTRSLNEGRVVACEAGTGVGKSFAYLVPSILWAMRNRERVVVSTGTIHLQEQLVLKDLPFLRKALDMEFRFALTKGRGNYACRRKLSELPDELQAVPPGEDEKRELEHLVEWAEGSADGSLADLGALPRREAWERVLSESDTSLKEHCEFYSSCFYYEARRRAASSQILVANHHLFFADLAARGRSGHTGDLVLPRYARVVFDEAHHLEDVASEHFSTRFSRRGVARRIGRMCSRDRRRGRVPVTARKLRLREDHESARRLEEGFAAHLPDVAERIDSEFAAIEELFREERGRGTFPGVSADPADERAKVRYRPGQAAAFWQQVKERLGAIRGHVEQLLGLNARAGRVIDEALIDPAGRDSARLDFESFAARLMGFLEDIERFSSYGDASCARWIDPAEGGGAAERRSVAFAAVPVRIADHLVNTLYVPVRSVVLTSATLSVAGNAGFLADRLGLDQVGEERFRFHRHESPFDFPRQVLTVVPDDVPAPDQPGYERELGRGVLDVVRATGGRAFVLFTSYRLLERIYRELAPELLRRGLSPLAQGEAQRSELIRRFRAGNSSVLFGTDSFWEGVDVKGEALECVIITRLPFRVPTDPLNEARLEEIRRRGDNPFAAFTVPQAVLRFRQGFGRLVRSEDDRGVVAILDSRVLTRSYGRTFLQSIPRTAFCAAPLGSAVAEIERFFGARSGEPSSAPSRAPAAAVSREGPERSATGGRERPPPWDP